MHDGGFGINYYHDKNGNQCGDISEVVVTPSGLSEASSVAEFTITSLDCVGSSLKNHGGNSTWGSNFKFYWHAKGAQGFYGNQFVNTYKLTKIGKAISKVAGTAGYFLDGYNIYNGYTLDGNQFGYNTTRATGGVVEGVLGAKAGAAIGAWFGGVGAIPGAIIGGVIGGVAGSVGGSMLGEYAVDYIYSR